jgi:hypothetical protein
MNGIEGSMLNLLAECNNATPSSNPTASHLAEMAAERGIVDNKRDGWTLIWYLFDIGEIEGYEVDGFGPFLVLKGGLPSLDELPKAGDEIVLVEGGASTPRCGTEVGA